MLTGLVFLLKYKQITLKYLVTKFIDKYIKIKHTGNMTNIKIRTYTL